MGARVSTPAVSGVLYVVPTYPGRSASIVANWVAAADLAEALGQHLGGAQLLTPLGLRTPAEVRQAVVRESSSMGTSRRVFRRLPGALRLAAWEARDMRRSRSMRALARTVAGRPYRLVVELHRRHQDCAQVIARAAGAPLVRRVEALEVREDAAWGIRRPGWGRALEWVGEVRLIRRADLVASVSGAVDAQLSQVGIEPRRRVVVPNGVDLERFSPGRTHRSLRADSGLGDRFVVGWVGGFRPYHGMEMIPLVARGLRERLPGAVICLLGTGPGRDGLVASVRGLEDTVRILGPVPRDQVPDWIRTFDVCLLLAGSGPFHYSPLKLYEYLGCGRPVVAARVGEVLDVLDHERDGLLVPPGNADAVVQSLVRLANDPALRERLGAQARRTAVEQASWDHRARIVLEALRDRDLLGHRPRDVSRVPGAR